MKLSIIALAGAMLAAPLLAFGSAQAVTINSTTPTWTHLVGGSNTQINVHDGNFLDVRWGVPMEWQRSGLGFDPASPPAVNEPINTPFLLGTLQHYNNPIATGSAASSVDLDLLTNIAGASPLNQTFQYRFIINETPNVYPCQFPSGNNPCADQITFQKSRHNVGFHYRRSELYDRPNGFLDGSWQDLHQRLHQPGGVDQ